MSQMVEGDDLEIKHATFLRAGADRVYHALTTLRLPEYGDLEPQPAGAAGLIAQLGGVRR